MSTVEEIQAKLAKIEAERDQLKKELAIAQSSAVGDWTLRQRTSLVDILERPDGGVGLVGSTLGVAGWIKTIRMAAKDTLAFVKVNDGSVWEGIQVVVEQTCTGFSHIKDHSAALAASVFIIGKLVDSPGKGQRVELKAIEFRLLGTSDAAAYPLANKEHTVEYLRTVGHFRPRTQLITAISRVRNALAFATHLYFQQEKGFYYVNTPLITASDCEGAGEMFQVTTLLKDAKDDLSKVPKLPDGKVDYSADFFKRTAYLTVSGQLNGEIYACAMGSVYTFGPTFRAENSNTARHLAEFWMIEPEIAFADLRENMEVAEGYVRYVLKYTLEHHQAELEYLENYEKKQIADRKKSEEEKSGKSQKQVRDFKETPLRERLQAIVNANFARCSYTEAIDILIKAIAGGRQFVEPVSWGIDMGSEHERYLA